MKRALKVNATLALLVCFTFLKAMQLSSLLEHKADPYGGVVIQISSKTENFKQKLADSLAQWKQEKKRGIWLTVPLEYAEYVPAAVKEGFVPHHATQKKFVLTKWLAEHEENKLPVYATRTAGVSAIVIDDQNRILLVKEKYHPEWGYKMPSAAIPMGENIGHTAVRKTKEETGIDTEFVGIISFCESHDTSMDGASNHFFACLMRPKSFEIKAQESEVSEVIWMPLEEYKKIAWATQIQFLRALETSGQNYIPYEVHDFHFPEKKDKMMTYFARPSAQIH